MSETIENPEPMTERDIGYQAAMDDIEATTRGITWSFRIIESCNRIIGNLDGMTDEDAERTRQECLYTLQTAVRWQRKKLGAKS